MTAAELRVRLALPYQAPPASLSLNWRGHWSERHKAAAQVRSDVTVLARQAGLHRYGPGEVAHVRVQLVWAPGDKRRRDAPNYAPMVKACVDALARGRADLVGIDLVPDDTPRWLTELPTVILPPPATRSMRLDLWLELAAAENGPEDAAVALAGNSAHSSRTSRSGAHRGQSVASQRQPDTTETPEAYP